MAAHIAGLRYTRLLVGVAVRDELAAGRDDHREAVLPDADLVDHPPHFFEAELAGEFSLEEMWRMVDQIRIGEHGFAMVVAPGGELVAHGDPDKKARVAQTRNMS